VHHQSTIADQAEMSGSETEPEVSEAEDVALEDDHAGLGSKIAL